MNPAPPSNRIVARYLIETAHPLEQAAAHMAGEQSSGTFVAIPGETDELKQRFGAQIIDIEECGEASVAALPGSKQPASAPLKQAKVTLSFPLENTGHSLFALFAQVAGNLFELSPFSGLKLLDLDIPDELAKAHPGPQFGVEGTRKLANVYDRPLIGTIVKPSVGLAPADTAALVKQLLAAGIDFIKDDELIANPPYSPIKDRVAAVMPVINDHAEKTGKKAMYAFNISDEPEAMIRHHDTVLAGGGTCVMTNMIPVGLSGLSYLRKRSQLPIHGHRAGWGMLSRHPLLGMSYLAFQKFFRLVGVDHLHVNGLRNKFCEPDDSVLASAKTCLAPMAGRHAVMPVFSSGQSALQAPDTYQRLGSVDLMYLAGGGIMAHPDGPAAGMASLKQSWEAAIKGISLEEYSKTHDELAKALQKYAKPK